MTAPAYERHFRQVIHDTPEWVRPPFAARKVLLRMYEIRCVVNGVSTIEYEMTTRTRADALHRLKSRYRRVHDVAIETRTVKPLAFAELVFKHRYDPRGLTKPTREIAVACWMVPIRLHESGAAARTRASVDGQALELDFDQHWAKPFAASARRVAAGKALDPRERPGAPPRLLAGWPFVLVRKVLRQDKGSGFEVAEDFLTNRHAIDECQAWSSLLPREFVKELPGLLARLKALGYVSQSGMTWKVTAKGRKERGRSQGRITRDAALAAIDRLVERITEINKTQTYCYMVDVAVVFGSVLDPGKGRVGDVDLAYRLTPRIVDKVGFDKMRKAKIANCPEAQARKLYGDIGWPVDEVVQKLTSAARGVVQARRLDEFETLFEDQRKKPPYRVLYGSWAPPPRARKRRSGAGR